MTVNIDKFLEDYKNAIYDREQILQQKQIQIESDSISVKKYISDTNLPESIYEDFIAKVIEVRDNEFNTVELDKLINFYEKYIIVEENNITTELCK